MCDERGAVTLGAPIWGACCDGSYTDVVDAQRLAMPGCSNVC